MKDKRGATLIELIVTATIVSIIAAATAGIVIYLMQLFIYIPKEIKAKNIANDLIEIMVEGKSQLRGMRYAVQVQDASSAQFTYTFGYPGGADKRNMRFRWDSGAEKVYRSCTAFGDAINGPQPPYGSEELIPYDAGSGISINGSPSSPSVIFTYYKQPVGLVEQPWVSGTDDLSTIRRAEVTISVTTGAGSFQDWGGSFQTTASVEIKQYI